jgi:hypothetical protein
VAVRLAIGNAQSSIQCYLSERSIHRPMAVPLMAFLLHSQRLVDALVLLSSCHGLAGGSPAPPAFQAMRDWTLTTLLALAAALERHELPGLLPDLHGEQALRERISELLTLPLETMLESIVGLQNAVMAWSDWEIGEGATAAQLTKSSVGRS